MDAFSHFLRLLVAVVAGFLKNCTVRKLIIIFASSPSEFHPAKTE